MPVSLFGLERLPLIKRIHHARKEIADIRGDQELKPFLKEYDSVDTVAREGHHIINFRVSLISSIQLHLLSSFDLSDDFLELSRTIMSCLEFFHSSSRILEQALKDPMKQDALPMPHDLHRYYQRVDLHIKIDLNSKVWKLSMYFFQGCCKHVWIMHVDYSKQKMAAYRPSSYLGDHYPKAGKTYFIWSFFTQLN